MKKNSRNTKGKIVSAAWKLFYEQGYDDTTVEEIVEESGTSRGSFYHYFKSKDDLLTSLAYLFDEKYDELDREYQNILNYTEDEMLNLVNTNNTCKYLLNYFAKN